MIASKVSKVIIEICDSASIEAYKIEIENDKIIFHYLSETIFLKCIEHSDYGITVIDTAPITVFSTFMVKIINGGLRTLGYAK